MYKHPCMQGTLKCQQTGNVSLMPYKSYSSLFCHTHLLLLCCRHHGGTCAWVNQLFLRRGTHSPILDREGVLPGVLETIQKQAQVRGNTVAYTDCFNSLVLYHWECHLNFIHMSCTHGWLVNFRGIVTDGWLVCLYAHRYAFYDGPPFATGLPHYGHILAGTIKDIVTRFAHQSGFHVDRRFGWDCHGLPVVRAQNAVVHFGYLMVSKVFMSNYFQFDIWAKTNKQTKKA